MATPRSLIRALYQHWDSIEHLVRLSRETPSFDRGQILAVLNQHQPENNDEKHVESLQLLVNADLLQPLPRSQAFELHPLVTDFVRNLTHDHDLGLSEVLRARIDAIQEGTSRLAASMQSGDRRLKASTSGHYAWASR